MKKNIEINLTNFVQFILAIIISSIVISAFVITIKIVTTLELSLTLQDWNNIISNVLQFVLVILGFFVFVQIKIAKDAYKVGCERDALRKSVDLAHEFANVIIPKIDKYYRNLAEKSFFATTRELKNFCMEDISQLIQEEKEKCKKDIYFFRKNETSRIECIYVLNNLEAFAINITKLVADEDSLFTALSQVYCSFVERNYAVICLLRNTKNDLYYVNLIDLYKEWSRKIKLEGLKVESKGLSAKLEENIKICNNSIVNKFVPRGTK